MTELPDINGDGVADYAVQDVTRADGRGGYSRRGFAVFTTNATPPCFTKVLEGSGGGVQVVKTKQPLKPGEWAELTTHREAMLSRGGRGYLQLTVAHESSGYLSVGGDASSCTRNGPDDTAVSAKECQSLIDDAVCAAKGEHSGPACGRVCAGGNRQACDALCLSSSGEASRRACLQVKAIGAQERVTCLKGDLDACQTACHLFNELDSCEYLCRRGDGDGCRTLSVKDRKRYDRLCLSGVLGECEHSTEDIARKGAEVREERLVREQCAKLPALFRTCEASRSRVYKWKKAWIDARRRGDYDGTQAAEQELQNLNEPRGKTLGEIREAIRVLTGDEGAEFGKLLLEVNRRRNLPRSAGF